METKTKATTLQVLPGTIVPRPVVVLLVGVLLPSLLPSLLPGLLPNLLQLEVEPNRHPQQNHPVHRDNQLVPSPVSPVTKVTASIVQ